MRLVLAMLVLSLGLLAVAIDRTAGSRAAPGTAVIAVDADPVTPGTQASAVYALGVAQIMVDATVDAPSPTGAFEFEVLYDPMRLRFDGWDAGAFLGSTGRQPSCYQFALERSVRIGCATSGQAPAAPSGSGVLATLRFRPLSLGEACLVLLLAKTAGVDGSSLPTVGRNGCLFFSEDGDGDSDDDGCTDIQELGANPQSGGLRDPENPWDFFDVTGDRAVDLLDALSVLHHFGLDADAPGVELRDRYVPNAGQPWRSAEADNGIDLVDALAALASFGSNCNVH